MYDKESKEWSDQFNYQLQTLKASQGDFRLALQEIGHCSDVANSTLHNAFLSGSYEGLGVFVAGMINREIIREAEEATERYLDNQSTINGKI
jgi:hypothetical protein